MTTSSSIRVRFAPSPTGYVHVGSLRTALYNYLFAYKHSGKYILRLEDTDQKRFVSGAAENLLTVLHTMGLPHSEGPCIQGSTPHTSQNVHASTNYPGLSEVGDLGPYIQSERLEIYQKYAQQLIDEGKAYYCFCSAERLAKMREEQTQNKQMPKYDRECLRLSADTIADNIATDIPRVVRLLLPENETITFTDAIRGEVSFKTDSMSDTVLLKSDGYPVYHLASIVDDHLMHISHVIRAEEWLSSTPTHLLLYRAFGWDAPIFAHLPLILNPDKSKLSKRQGDVAVEDYLQKGYLKEALINFVALLGWNPGEGSTQEIFSLEELIQQFDFDHVHKAGAVFDLKKLDWINAQYIKKLSLDDLYEQSLPFWLQKDFYTQASSSRQSKEYLLKVLAVEQDRLNRLDEVGEHNPFFFNENIACEKDLLRWKNNTDEETSTALTKAQHVLETVDETQWTREYLSELLMAEAGDKRGDMLWPLRVALTGAKQSPSPFEVMWVIGKETSLNRIAQALQNF